MGEELSPLEREIILEFAWRERAFPEQSRGQEWLFSQAFDHASATSSVVPDTHIELGERFIGDAPFFALRDAGYVQVRTTGQTGTLGITVRPKAMDLLGETQKSPSQRAIERAAQAATWTTVQFIQAALGALATGAVGYLPGQLTCGE